jgi:hypothetical protein
MMAAIERGLWPLYRRMLQQADDLWPIYKYFLAQPNARLPRSSLERDC